MESPRIYHSTHVLAVQNLGKSVDYYKQQLGFKSVWEVDGWHCVELGEFRLMLGECPDDVSAFETNNHSYFAYVDVDGLDALYNDWVKKPVKIIKPPKNEPWGQREFGIQTVDGHRILFGEEIGESQT